MRVRNYSAEFLYLLLLCFVSAGLIFAISGCGGGGGSSGASAAYTPSGPADGPTYVDPGPGDESDTDADSDADTHSDGDADADGDEESGQEEDSEGGEESAEEEDIDGGEESGEEGGDGSGEDEEDGDEGSETADLPDPFDYSSDEIPDADYKVVITNLPSIRPTMTSLQYGVGRFLDEGYYSSDEQSFTFILPDDYEDLETTSVGIITLDNASYNDGVATKEQIFVEAGVPYEIDYSKFSVSKTSYSVWVRSNTDEPGHEGMDLVPFIGEKLTMTYTVDGETYYTADGKVSEYPNIIEKPYSAVVARVGLFMHFSSQKTDSPYIIVTKIKADNKVYNTPFIVRYGCNKDGGPEFVRELARGKYPQALCIYELLLEDFH